MSTKCYVNIPVPFLVLTAILKPVSGCFSPVIIRPSASPCSHFMAGLLILNKLATHTRYSVFLSQFCYWDF